MNITKCPTAYAVGANSRQGRPVSDADKQALRDHDAVLNRRSEAARQRMAVHMAKLHEYSPVTRKRT